MSTPPGPQEPTGPESPYGSTPPSYGSAPPPPAYGGGGGYQPAGSPPPNYLVWAIISVFLCWPLAIPAIVFSTQVNSKWAQGDAAGAADSSRKAKQFALWATILGGIVIVLYIALAAAGVITAATTGTTY
ncbi:CD225/dispanin family protein [Actinotalea ferrariae]|uniref:CD225/dispanin family protein n=1 Tax=Actinotalea ferrariae TaxID=1386098 RepID=UPI001C8C4BFA|nr:CD225/dispanin family protein [Actinotalea ferrariae]MBX9244212.1 CD225/dispanin family protein [Actinotalea ferrariae]